MSETQKALVILENMLKTRYSKLLKLFIVLAVLFVIWVAVVALGIVFLELGPAWALVTLDTWVSILIVLLAVFIILEVMFYIHYYMVKNKYVTPENNHDSTGRALGEKRRIILFFHHPHFGEFFWEICICYVV